MRTDRMGAISLVLSVITLALVLSVAVRPTPQAVDVAVRPTPQAVDPGPALFGLRSDLSALRADIAELRAIAERPTASPNPDQSAAILARLDSLESAVGGIATKFAALCNAVNASPISPPGGAC